MARLPVPGQDDGTWGDILNDFLRQTLNDDGSLKALSQSQVTGLTQALADKALQTDLDALQTTVAGKADAASVYDKTTADGRYVQSVTVGTTTTGVNVAAGGAAAVTNSGTASAPVLNFTVPKGDPGDLVPSSFTNVAGGVIGVASTEVPSTKIRTLASNVIVNCTSNPSNSVSGTVTLVLKQAATGSGPYTVTWGSMITWAGGAPAPVMPSTAGARLVVHLFWTGQEWLGMVGGTFF